MCCVHCHRKGINLWALSECDVTSLLTLIRLTLPAAVCERHKLRLQLAVIWYLWNWPGSVGTWSEKSGEFNWTTFSNLSRQKKKLILSHIHIVWQHRRVWWCTQLSYTSMTEPTAQKSCMWAIERNKNINLCSTGTTLSLLWWNIKAEDELGKL